MHSCPTWSTAAATDGLLFAFMWSWRQPLIMHMRTALSEPQLRLVCVSAQAQAWGQRTAIRKAALQESRQASCWLCKASVLCTAPLPSHAARQLATSAIQRAASDPHQAATHSLPLKGSR